MERSTEQEGSGIMILGCHLSPAKGLAQMAETAARLGADTFQFFTRNPRGSRAKELDPLDVVRFQTFLSENRFGEILVHAPYTLNPSAEKDGTRDFAELALSDDLERVAKMGLRLYNIHPGSHVGQGTEKGINRTCDLLNRIISDSFPGIILLETMAGQGSEIGGTFDEIKEMIDRIVMKDKIGVCLDTCHVYAAGYDIAGDPDRVLTEFDRLIGMDRLKYIHLNDSKYGCGMHKDRHAAIGKGEIGTEGIRRIINHPALKGLPFCLETPHEDLEEYAEEIELVRNLRERN